MTFKQLQALRAEPVGCGGNRIAAAIHIVGCNQMDVSRGTGLTPGRVSDFIAGRVPCPRIDTVRKFAEFFGCQIEDIFPAREEAAAS